ncbi:hypothetical protein AXF42_Ash000207 [Apostasia shenzhenica]|uniref:DUF630 domain-containing protein n=1 Tax=Apostasia shenzhenica TaxID=1088818 RepID=A0A2I0AFP2_9ASPA|nr:hypothetical protein AXF42_Ash000207 [Apostasia shenzhenica]
MGCTQSLIENEESVTRCKERKQFMKSAVAARNAFAAAHSAYALALKNTGSAIYDYAHGEVHDLRPSSTTTLSSSSTTTADHASSSTYSAAAVAGSAAGSVQPPVDRLPPPPPPLPADLSPAAPLQRSASMPGLPMAKIPRKETKNEPEIIEEGTPEATTEHSETDTGEDSSTAPAVPPAPPKPPQPSEAPVQLPPPPSANESSWYLNLFNTEHILAPSLRQPDEAMVDREGEKFENAVASHDASSNEFPQPIPSPVVSEKGASETPLPTQQKPGKMRRPSGGSGSSHNRSRSSGGASESKRGKMPVAVPQNVSFLQIMNEMDDHFLKASHSAHMVSKILDATRLHYHSNYADVRGHLEHSEKIMKVIRWNKPIGDNGSEGDTKDDLDDEKWETHAIVLEKMQAWEKKLYDEVKAAELIKIGYQRKLSLLNKQKKKATNPETLETIKAAVSHLHTRYIVDIQSMDSTISEINSLRDHKLCPKLVELVNE